MCQHCDRVDPNKFHSYECCQEDEDADVECPSVIYGIAKIIFCAKHQGRSSKQSDNSRTKTCKYHLYIMVFHILQEQHTDEHHEYEARQHQSKRGSDASQNTQHIITCFVHDSSIAAIGSAIDTNRAWRHLGYCHDISEFCRRYPMMVDNHLMLYEGQHSVSSTESEESYQEECIE